MSRAIAWVEQQWGHPDTLGVPVSDRGLGLADGDFVGRPGAGLRCGLGAPAYQVAVIWTDELVETLSGQAVLGKEIRRILFSKYFPEVYPFASDCLLHP